MENGNLIGKICDSLKFVFSFKWGHSQKSKAQDQGNVQSALATGNAPAINIQGDFYIGANESGKRYVALKNMEEAIKGLLYAIDQSKNPRIGNTPSSYQRILRESFKKACESGLTEEDIKSLEPLIHEATHNNPFIELSAPCENLHSMLKLLMQSRKK